VLVGCRNVEQVKRNVAALEWDLNDVQVRELSEHAFGASG